MSKSDIVNEMNILYKYSQHRSVDYVVWKYLISNIEIRNDEKLKMLDDVDFKAFIFSLVFGYFGINGYSNKPFITYFTVGSTLDASTDIINNLPYNKEDFLAKMVEYESLKKTEIKSLIVVFEAYSLNHALAKPVNFNNVVKLIRDDTTISDEDVENMYNKINNFYNKEV